MLLILVFLSYVSDSQLKTAGGTVHFLECIRRWSKRDNLKIVTLTTPLGANVLAKHGFHSRFILTNAIREGRTDTLSTMVSWISRCFSLIGMAPDIEDNEEVVVLTESHLLPDIFAGHVLRRLFPEAKLICYLHHLIPQPSIRLKYHPALPSISAWMAQKVSLLLMKISQFNIFTYPSNFAALSKEKFSPSRIIPIASGVDINMAANELGGNTLFEACYLGRLSPLKGVVDLVGIWKIVCEKLPRAKLAIAGSGDEGYTKTLENQVRRCGMEKNIHFLGWLSGFERFRFLKSSKVLVSASREEGWGISICEAMACELPVVAYDNKSYRWAFQQGIILAPRGDLKSFAHVLISLLTNEELRLSVGKQALEQSMKYDWNEIASKELSKIYQITLGHDDTNAQRVEDEAV
jgi:glycosyltransferase involved in cell wall biosynthesis